MQQPSVGRAVHYVSYGSPVGPDGEQKFKSVCRAATITEVANDGVRGTVGLAVLNPSGVFFHGLSEGGAKYDEWDSTTALDGALPQGGSWHWPERV